MTDEERDARNGDQWLCSVVSYLEFRAGKSWRKLHRAGERFNDTRWYYLQATQQVKNLRYAPVEPCACLRCLVHLRKPVAHEGVAMRKEAACL